MLSGLGSGLAFFFTIEVSDIVGGSFYVRLVPTHLFYMNISNFAINRNFTFFDNRRHNRQPFSHDRYVPGYPPSLFVNIREAIQLYIEVMLEEGQPIPTE